jgi:hypothetical protein
MTIGRKILPVIALVGAAIAGGARATPTPINVAKVVDLVHEIGRINKKPASCKDWFSPEAHGLNSS